MSPKPLQPVVAFRLPANHYAAISAAAKQEDRTLAAQIRLAVREYIERNPALLANPPLRRKVTR